MEAVFSKRCEACQRAFKKRPFPHFFSFLFFSFNYSCYLCGGIAKKVKTEKQIAAKKHFAGEAKPSMKRRDDHNDYSGRRMYMVTITRQVCEALNGLAWEISGGR